jgi:hypothetical protein
MSPRFALLMLASASLLFAIDPGRDFSGRWILTSGTRLSVPFEATLTIEQGENEIRCSFDDAHWTYALNGTERKVQIGGDMRNSLVKWEGAALLINTIVTGSHDYVVMDRWRLSPDHANLTVTRQIIRGVKQEEGSMVYRRDSPAAAPPPQTPAPRELPPPRPAPVATPAPAPPPPALARREAAPPVPSEVVLRAGTHIPLTFRNTVDTRHSHEGERIYLETAFPVAQDGFVVIPRGAFVNGVITQIKPPGHTGKGEMFIRFDVLALPNGVKRDLQSRLASGDEGKIEGQPDRGADARKIGGAAGTGAGTGVTAGSAAGHAGMGAGIGGATAGIASVLLSRGADASLPQGTTVDMVLDRDLRFRADELR